MKNTPTLQDAITLLENALHVLKSEQRAKVKQAADIIKHKRQHEVDPSEYAPFVYQRADARGYYQDACRFDDREEAENHARTEVLKRALMKRRDVKACGSVHDRTEDCWRGTLLLSVIYDSETDTITENGDITHTHAELEAMRQNRLPAKHGAK